MLRQKQTLPHTLLSFTAYEDSFHLIPRAKNRCWAPISNRKVIVHAGMTSVSTLIKSQLSPPYFYVPGRSMSTCWFPVTCLMCCSRGGEGKSALQWEQDTARHTASQVGTLSARGRGENRAYHHFLGICFNTKQNRALQHILQEARDTLIVTSQIHHLAAPLVQVRIQNMSSSPPQRKVTFMLSTFLSFSFHYSTVIYYLVLAEIYLGLYICTETQLFHFFPALFFSPHKEPASISLPISCSLSKGCFGLSSSWKLDSSDRESWKLCLGSFPVSVFSHQK